MTLSRFGSINARDETRRTVGVTAAGVLAFDQMSKAMALTLFADADRSFGPLRFTIVRNSGGPFGVADGASIAWTASTGAILIAAVVVIGRSRLGFRLALAVGAMLGGGLGNLMDRLVRQPGAGSGAVIDWISFEPYPRVFNLADVALRVAAVTVLMMMLVVGDRTRTAARQQAADPGSNEVVAGFPSHSSNEKGTCDMVRAHWNGTVIAESDDTVIIDGNHYFPVESVGEQFLVPSTTTTVCPSKGQASYYSVNVDGQLNPDAAWYYPSPRRAAKKITGRIAFWRGVKIEEAGPSVARRSFFDRFRRRPDEIRSAHAESGTAGVDEAAAVAVVVDLDDGSFFGALEGKVSIVDFWAPWCGPCKQLHPLFDTQAAAHSDVGLQFARVNVDESPGVATAFNVMSIPTIIVVDPDGQELEREIGLPGKRRLEQLANNAGSIARKIIVADILGQPHSEADDALRDLA